MDEKPITDKAVFTQNQSDTQNEIIIEQIQTNTDSNELSSQSSGSSNCVVSVSPNDEHLHTNKLSSFISTLSKMLRFNTKSKKINPFTRPVMIERRRAILRLKYLIFLLCLVLSPFLLFSFSFVFKEHTEWANICIGLGTGITTGIVLYFLNNLRNNRYNQLEYEVTVLKQFYETIHNIKRICYKYTTLSKLLNSYLWVHQLEDDSKSYDDVIEILFLLDTIRNKHIGPLLSLKLDVIWNRYDQLDTLYIRYKESAENNSYNSTDEWMEAVLKELTDLWELLRPFFNEREHQLKFIKSKMF